MHLGPAANHLGACAFFALYKSAACALPRLHSNTMAARGRHLSRAVLLYGGCGTCAVCGAPCSACSARIWPHAAIVAAGAAVSPDGRCHFLYVGECAPLQAHAQGARPSIFPLHRGTLGGSARRGSGSKIIRKIRFVI